MPAAHPPQRSLADRVKTDEQAEKDDVGQAHIQFVRRLDVAGVGHGEQQRVGDHRNPQPVSRGDQLHQPAPEQQLFRRALDDEAQHQHADRQQGGTDGGGPERARALDHIATGDPDHPDHGHQEGQPDQIAAHKPQRPPGVQAQRRRSPALEQPGPEQQENRAQAECGPQLIGHLRPAVGSAPRRDKARRDRRQQRPQLSADEEDRAEHDRGHRPGPPVPVLSRGVEFKTGHPGLLVTIARTGSRDRRGRRSDPWMQGRSDFAHPTPMAGCR